MAKNTKIRAASTSDGIVQAAEEIYRDELSDEYRREIDEMVRDAKIAAEIYGVHRFGLMSAFELIVKVKVWLANGGEQVIRGGENGN